LSKLRSSETRGVHSNIKKTSGGTRSQKVWEPLVYAKYENGCVFAKTKPKPIITMALQ